MQAHLLGEVVDLEKNDWSMNGKTGTAYTAFVRTGDAREAAQRVKITESQFIRLDKGVILDALVNITCRANDFGGAKLVVVLDPEHDVLAVKDSYASSAA